MSDYFLFQLIYIILPLFIVLLITKGRIFRYPKTLFWMLLFVYTVGWFWDWLSVKTGVWSYDTGHTFGIWIDGIPIEEFIGFYFFGTLFIVAVIDLFTHKTRLRGRSHFGEAKARLRSSMNSGLRRDEGGKCNVRNV